jgi:hypothetical protein
MKLQAVRKLATSLPEVTEEPHFDMSSFRVRGKIFCTVPPDGKHVHIFVDEHATHAAVAHNSGAFEELYWGKKLSGVRVTLASADADLVRDLLEEAWRRKAPKKLASGYQ